MGNQETGEITSDLEKSFNETLEEFRKSFGTVEETVEDTQEDKDLEKAGKSDSKAMDYDDDADDAEESEDDDEDEEDEDVKKSVEDILAEDVEAEAAMDVEPFLRQLAKAIDQRIDGLQKSFGDHYTGVETMLKSQGKAMYLQMELQKSQSDTVQKIAKEDVEVRSLHRFQKSRFEDVGGGEPLEVQGTAVLEKSLSWLQEGKIDHLESGLIERRVNQGRLGKEGDALDQKVGKLMKEVS